MSIYPTLCDLVGLDVPDHVDGVSIRRILEDSMKEEESESESRSSGGGGGIALSTMGYRNHAVRSQRYRYIRYEDGSEELYDHDVDEYEFTNLANDDEYDATKRELSAYLPPEDGNMPPWTAGQTCKKDGEVIVKKCQDGRSFVARDPNNACAFRECPAAAAAMATASDSVPNSETETPTAVPKTGESVSPTQIRDTVTGSPSILPTNGSTEPPSQHSQKVDDVTENEDDGVPTPSGISSATSRTYIGLIASEVIGIIWYLSIL
mmetsp:Transcript_6300/g.13735  ORF Transcript_6300/g.13735 Transcript_6300/m.13735 type:complete len:264 (-) Transcript_6300:216-1007(-)